MKIFNLYVNKTMYDTETEEQLYPDLKEDIKVKVDELKRGDSYTYKNDGHNSEWEIERVC